MNSIQVWIYASRPKTLIAGISPVLIGSTLAFAQGSFNWIIFFFTLLTSLSVQIGANLTNDYYDFIKGADTIDRKGFLRVTQAGLVTLKSMKMAIVLTFFIAVCCGYTLILKGGLGVAITLLIYILLAILYTAGPLPLAYLGLGDFLVFFLCGPTSVLITYYLQTGEIANKAFIAGISSGAFAMAILVINNIRDIREDKLVGKRTLPVRFGKTFGIGFFIFSILLAFFPPLYFYSIHPFSLLPLLTIFPALLLIVKVVGSENPHQLNPLFAKMGQLLWIFTLLFCASLML